MAGVTAVATGLGALMGFGESRKRASAEEKAAGEAVEIGALNRAALEAETAETVRRTELSQKASTASAKAKAAASGATGSMETVIGAMGEEQARELSWIKKAGLTEAELITKEAASAASAGRAGARGTRARGVGSLLTGVGGVATSGTKAGWWG